MMQMTWQERYRYYMASPGWTAKKAEYAADHRFPNECYVCGAAGLEDKDFHHRTYKRLGHENLLDIVPTCKVCHIFVHMIRDGMPEAASMWAATDMARAKVQTDPARRTTWPSKHDDRPPTETIDGREWKVTRLGRARGAR